MTFSRHISKAPKKSLLMNEPKDLNLKSRGSAKSSWPTSYKSASKKSKRRCKPRCRRRNTRTRRMQRRSRSSKQKGYSSCDRKENNWCSRMLWRQWCQRRIRHYLKKTRFDMGLWPSPSSNSVWCGRLRTNCAPKKVMSLSNSCCFCRALKKSWTISELSILFQLGQLSRKQYGETVSWLTLF